MLSKQYYTKYLVNILQYKVLFVEQIENVKQFLQNEIIFYDSQKNIKYVSISQLIMWLTFLKSSKSYTVYFLVPSAKKILIESVKITNFLILINYFPYSKALLY